MSEKCRNNNNKHNNNNSDDPLTSRRTNGGKTSVSIAMFFFNIFRQYLLLFSKLPPFLSTSGMHLSRVFFNILGNFQLTSWVFQAKNVYPKIFLY